MKTDMKTEIIGTSFLKGFFNNTVMAQLKKSNVMTFDRLEDESYKTYIGQSPISSLSKLGNEFAQSIIRQICSTPIVVNNYLTIHEFRNFNKNHKIILIHEDVLRCFDIKDRTKIIQMLEIDDIIINNDCLIKATFDSDEDDQYSTLLLNPKSIILKYMKPIIKEINGEICVNINYKLYIDTEIVQLITDGINPDVLRDIGDIKTVIQKHKNWREYQLEESEPKTLFGLPFLPFCLFISSKKSKSKRLSKHV